MKFPTADFSSIWESRLCLFAFSSSSNQAGMMPNLIIGNNSPVDSISSRFVICFHCSFHLSPLFRRPFVPTPWLVYKHLQTMDVNSAHGYGRMEPGLANVHTNTHTLTNSSRRPWRTSSAFRGMLTTVIIRFRHLAAADDYGLRWFNSPNC